MPNDRGTIKWTSLMLPEHVQLLQELWQNDGKRKKPVLDEQKLEEMDRELFAASRSGQTVKLSIYEHGIIHICRGKISLNREEKIVTIKNNQENKMIPIANILSIE